MSYKECLTCSGYLIAVLSLIVASIAYIVFGIVYLIQDYKISNECKESDLWEYVLVSIILSCINITIKTENENKDAIVSLVMIGVINLILSTWGGVELWDYSYPCDELFNSDLWKVGLAGFILQVITSIICLIAPPILLCYIRITEARNINNIEEPNRIEEVINENNLNLRINTDV